MVDYTQEKRRLSVDTPLGKDVLLLASFSGSEQISGLFDYQLQMLSTESSIAAKDIVGKNITVSVKLPDDSETYFNGFVSRFCYCGAENRLGQYSAEVVPWLWFLTRTSDCRIFQEKTIPDIIEEVFGDLGFSDYKLDLKGAHKQWEYCVQDPETDFQFVSRLMEQEGIFYYFEHEKGKHTLILGDADTAYVDCKEKDVDFVTDTNIATSAPEITSWEHSYEFRPGKWAHTDYNFKTPSTSLLANTNTIVDLDGVSKYEVFDYPGRYPTKGDGDTEVKLRMEEEEAEYDVVTGQSQCRTFIPGGKFTLKSHYSDAEKGKSYVLTSVQHAATEAGGYTTGGSAPSFDYMNTFTCIPDKTVFRPPRTTSKAIVHGAQTAVVVGPAGEEIYCDEYGRVKVQFHWDRLGANDDKSSCFVRVSQAWAGKGFGFVHIPRIGEEVIVDFLEGDPDQPMITGRVYHAENMPPYALPDNKTQTGLKSRSSKGGADDNFNEIRFEDLMGEEEVYIHAEKDENIVVENDKTEAVGHDETIMIGNDRTETVKNDETLTVENDRTRKVTKNESVSVGSNQTISVGKERSADVGDNDSLSVGKNQSVTIAKNQTISVGEGRKKSVGKDESIQVTKGRDATIGEDDVLNVGKKLVIDAGDQIVIQTGKAKLVMKKDGTVTIEGKDITMKASGKITGKASKEVTLKGSKVLANGNWRLIP